MLLEFFSKLKNIANTNRPAEQEPEVRPSNDGTSTFGRGFDETQTYRKTNTGELKHSNLANHMSSRNYTKAGGTYLTANAAKSDNWRTFNDMLDPVSGAYLAPLPTEKKFATAAESTFAVQIPVLDLSTAEVMNEILDTMIESSAERNTSDETHLSCHRADTYRRRWVLRIASDPNTPDVVLRRLAEEGDSAVQALVAENSNTPVDSIWRLAREPNSDIRYSLAENHAIAIEVLNLLADDENPYVAQRANKTLKRVGTSVVYDAVDFRSRQTKNRLSG